MSRNAAERTVDVCMLRVIPSGLVFVVVALASAAAGETTFADWALVIGLAAWLMESREEER